VIILVSRLLKRWLTKTYWFRVHFVWQKKVWIGNLWVTNADEAAAILSEKAVRIKLIENRGKERNPYIFRAGIAWQLEDSSIWVSIQ